MEYQKYSGAGNDFLIVNNVKGNIENKSDLTIELINKEKVQNFDGVIFVEDSDVAEFRMNYYNKDGTGDVLCGNGLRCTVKYILDNELYKKNDLTIEAVSKIFHCKVIDNKNISVSFPPPSKIKLNFKLKVQFVEWWQLLTASFIDIGAPHLVVFIDEIEKPKVKTLSEVDIANWGRNLRMHKDLMPGGTNVNFVEVISDEKNEIAIRSFERGVEGETLACGTGAISSAIVSYAVRKLIPPINVYTKSGNTLIVNFDIIENHIRNLTLTGPANKI